MMQISECPQVDMDRIRAEIGDSESGLRFLKARSFPRWQFKFWANHFELEAFRCEYPDPCSVLDVGCGFGYMDVCLALDGYEVVGLDTNPAMVRVARYLAELTGASVRFETTSIQGYGREADVCWCSHTMEHIPFEEWDGVTKQMRRLAKAALISMPKGDAFDDVEHISKVYTKEELEQRLPGFEVEELGSILRARHKR